MKRKDMPKYDPTVTDVMRIPAAEFVHTVPTNGTETFMPSQYVNKNGKEILTPGGWHVGDGSKNPGPGDSARKTSRHHRFIRSARPAGRNTITLTLGN